jgi:hypothetical protein
MWSYIGHTRKPNTKGTSYNMLENEYRLEQTRECYSAVITRKYTNLKIIKLGKMMISKISIFFSIFFVVVHIPTCI